jgi:hypothetical protein
MWVVRSARWWLMAAWLLSLAAPVQAQEVPGGGGWAPAAGAAGDNTYQGFVDRPSDGASWLQRATRCWRHQLRDGWSNASPDQP